jgi:hypothetical protein
MTIESKHQHLAFFITFYLLNVLNPPLLPFIYVFVYVYLSISLLPLSKFFKDLFYFIRIMWTVRIYSSNH